MDIESSIRGSALAPLACLLGALGWASFTNAASATATEDRSQLQGGGAAIVDGPASGAGEHRHGRGEGMRCGGDTHAHHRAMMARKGYRRSEHEYPLSDYRLTGMNGAETSLLQELGTDRPVMVNFIFTACTTICPVMSGVFSQVQKELGPESREVRMVSVSIDPEYDTPSRLRDYARRFQAGPQWQFLTGDADDIVAIQKAFDVYRGNKMSHEPTTLLRKSEEDPWVRLDGIASATDIVAEYRQLIGH